MNNLMLTHPTIDLLRTLRLHGMADAYAQQRGQPDIEVHSFDERLAFLVDRETTDRESRRLTNRLQKARLRQQATLADLDYSAARGLDKTVLRALAQNRWVREHQNLLIVGATGTGKTYLACALAHSACLAGHTIRYHRLSRLLAELLLARADGTYPKRILDLARADVLVLDDFGLTPITDAARTELFEILEDRHGHKSTVLTSQLPIAAWHEAVGEATVADAILDRLVHDSHRIDLKGDSLRRRRVPAPNPTEEPTPK